MADIGCSLQEMVEQADSLQAVRKDDLQAGDCVLVTTRNSVYRIWIRDNGVYSVAGGWFGPQPKLMTVNGCTWGGSAIKKDIVAAVGLHLEFGNGLLTTRIRQIRVIRGRAQSTCN